MESLVKIVVEAFPWLKGLVDTATVAISALPSFGAVALGVGIPGALVLFLYLFGADHFLFSDEDEE